MARQNKYTPKKTINKRSYLSLGADDVKKNKKIVDNDVARASRDIRMTKARESLT